MTAIAVRSLTFTFAPKVDAHQYEVDGECVPEWPPDKKVVDIVATDIRTCWLIEVKDFRILTKPPNRANNATLFATMDRKVRDSLKGLAHYATHGSRADLKAHAAASLARRKRRVVLHLEPHPPGSPQSALFPKRHAANILQKLKQLVTDIDKHPLVLDMASTPGSGVPWTVT